MGVGSGDISSAVVKVISKWSQASSAFIAQKLSLSLSWSCMLKRSLNNVAVFIFLVGVSKVYISLVWSDKIVLKFSIMIGDLGRYTPYNKWNGVTGDLDWWKIKLLYIKWSKEACQLCSWVCWYWDPNNTYTQYLSTLGVGTCEGRISLGSFYFNIALEFRVVVYLTAQFEICPTVVLWLDVS